MKKVFVVGSGTMGSGIVQACAQSGYSVVMMDINGVMLEKALRKLQWFFEKLEEKGKIKETKEVFLLRIVPSDRIDQGKNANIVIEAIHEDLLAKQDL
jgi:3-hydroxybutyryl-CoA dehydrogenase